MMHSAILLVHMRAFGKAIYCTVPHVERLGGIPSRHVDDLGLDRMTCVGENKLPSSSNKMSSSMMYGDSITKGIDHAKSLVASLEIKL